MRLLHTTSLTFEEFIGNTAPKYAILSHTWEDEEVSYQEFKSMDSGVAQKRGYKKIQEACRLAAASEFDWIWIDTCNIDKSSSAELTEAINSMYTWYRNAGMCLAYLSDVERSDDIPSFEKSRWFRRGWTLQELLAPEKLIFYDRSWGSIGDKQHWRDSIKSITGIPKRCLQYQEQIENCSVAQRMSWASERETTRIEDQAYCLLGIFDVNLPMLYGEGRKAFYRLQVAIMERWDDQSLLAWNPTQLDQNRSLMGLLGILAASPASFRGFQHVRRQQLHQGCYPWSISNKGVMVTAVLQRSKHSPMLFRAVLECTRDANDHHYAVITLIRLHDQSTQMVRVNEAVDFENVPPHTEDSTTLIDMVPGGQFKAQSIHIATRPELRSVSSLTVDSLFSALDAYHAYRKPITVRSA